MSKPAIVVVIVLVLLAAVFALGVGIGITREDEEGNPDDPQAPGWMKSFGDLFGPPGDPLDLQNRGEIVFDPEDARPKAGKDAVVVVPEDGEVTLRIGRSDEEFRHAKLVLRTSNLVVRVTYEPEGDDIEMEDEDRHRELKAGEPVKLVIPEDGATLTLENRHEEKAARVRFE